MRKNVLKEVIPPQFEPMVEAVCWKVEKEHFTFYIHKDLDNDTYYVNVDSVFCYQTWQTERLESLDECLAFISFFED